MGPGLEGSRAQEPLCPWSLGCTSLLVKDVFLFISLETHQALFQPAPRPSQVEVVELKVPAPPMIWSFSGHQFPPEAQGAASSVASLA